VQEVDGLTRAVSHRRVQLGHLEHSPIDSNSLTLFFIGFDKIFDESYKPKPCHLSVIGRNEADAFPACLEVHSTGDAEKRFSRKNKDSSGASRASEREASSIKQNPMEAIKETVEGAAFSYFQMAVQHLLQCRGGGERHDAPQSCAGHGAELQTEEDDNVRVPTSLLLSQEKRLYWTTRRS
jgi:hypothetical protein